MRYKEGKRHTIQYLLKNQPHLTPIFTSTLNIPERVHEYDRELFIVFNNKNERFEIHSLEGGESTYNATLPYKKLDARTIRYIRQNDIRVHGNKVHKEIDEQEKKIERANERNQQNFVRDFASEFQGEFAKDAWLM